MYIIHLHIPGCAFYDKSYQYISSFETNNIEHIEINTDNIPSDANTFV